jgi:hypothetical protein
MEKGAEAPLEETSARRRPCVQRDWLPLFDEPLLPCKLPLLLPLAWLLPDSIALRRFALRAIPPLRPASRASSDVNS